MYSYGGREEPHDNTHTTSGAGRIRNDFGIWVGVATLLAAAFTDLAFNYKSVLGGFADSVKVIGMAMSDAKANKEAKYVGVAIVLE